MNYAILFERISERGIPSDHWYAHIPSLGLTTHGKGIEGAREAAHDLASLWIAEKRANGESVAAPGEFLFSTLQLNDDAIQSA
jgi:predicted RNase H-like HicB family nuclease